MSTNPTVNRKKVQIVDKAAHCFSEQCFTNWQSNNLFLYRAFHLILQKFKIDINDLILIKKDIKYLHCTVETYTGLEKDTIPLITKI